MATITERDVDPQLVDVARRAFKAYARNSDGKTHDGKPIPPWEQLTPAVRGHWCAAVLAAVQDVEERLHARDAKRSSNVTAEPPQVHTEKLDDSPDAKGTQPLPPVPHSSVTAHDVAKPAQLEVTTKLGEPPPVPVQQQGGTQTRVEPRKTSSTSTPPAKK